MNPLLTFSVAGYNQERFIGDAIRCAFSQTYSPLEIILSDNTSTDGTFEVMRTMAAAYRGQHKIVLNRTETNKGLADHVNRIAKLARGELLVWADGDDISSPERTALLFKAWDATGRQAACVHSRATYIDESDREIEPPPWEPKEVPTNCVITQRVSPSHYVETLEPQILGCTYAWPPALFDIFNDLPEDVIHEDNILFLRSILLGKVVFVDTPLVKYRCHGGNLFYTRYRRAHTLKEAKEQERAMHRNFSRRAVMYRVFCRDLCTAHRRNLISYEDFSTAYNIAQNHKRLFSLQSDFVAASFAKKIRLLYWLYCSGADRVRLTKIALRLLPQSVLLMAKLVKGRFSRSSGKSVPRIHPATLHHAPSSMRNLTSSS